MSRFSSNAGIHSYRKTASLIVGSSLLFGTSAQASDLAATPVSAETEASGASTIPATAAATAAADAGETGDPIVITGEKYRINTLNSRLPDVRDAPQSIRRKSASPTAACKPRTPSTRR